jgi:hypothetical protein
LQLRLLQLWLARLVGQLWLACLMRQLVGRLHLLGHVGAVRLHLKLRRLSALLRLLTLWDLLDLLGLLLGRLSQLRLMGLLERMPRRRVLGGPVRLHLRLGLRRLWLRLRNRGRRLRWLLQLLLLDGSLLGNRRGSLDSRLLLLLLLLLRWPVRLCLKLGLLLLPRDRRWLRRLLRLRDRGRRLRWLVQQLLLGRTLLRKRRVSMHSWLLLPLLLLQQRRRLRLRKRSRHRSGNSTGDRGSRRAPHRRWHRRSLRPDERRVLHRWRGRDMRQWGGRHGRLRGHLHHGLCSYNLSRLRRLARGPRLSMLGRGVRALHLRSLAFVRQLRPYRRRGGRDGGRAHLVWRRRRRRRVLQLL